MAAGTDSSPAARRATPRWRWCFRSRMREGERWTFRIGSIAKRTSPPARRHCASRARRSATATSPRASRARRERCARWASGSKPRWPISGSTAHTNSRCSSPARGWERCWCRSTGGWPRPRSSRCSLIAAPRRFSSKRVLSIRSSRSARASPARAYWRWGPRHPVGRSVSPCCVPLRRCTRRTVREPTTRRCCSVTRRARPALPKVWCSRKGRCSGMRSIAPTCTT